MSDRKTERAAIRQRLADRRVKHVAPAPAPGPTPDQIARINALISTSRAAWLGLLSYLAFIGVTLLGVEDADFFLTERQTDLPLIGVSVPTNLFFAIAPALGAMLATYLHLYLVKLWEALAEAPLPTDDPALADRIQPWELADFALTFRKGARTVDTRPLGLLAWIVSLTLAFAATPGVLAAFWYRSMPKHDEALTVLACGIPLSFALYGAVASLLRLRRIMRGDDSALFHTRRARGAWGVGFVAVAVVGWLTTEGTFKAYAETAFGLESNSESWWAQTWFPALLVRADLRNVDFSYRPDDWKDFEQARSTFHREWCEANDLSPAVCGPVPDSDTVESEHQQVARLQWCRDALTLGGGANATRQRQRCTAYFDEWRAAFRQEWKDRRDLQRSTLQRRTLSGADLRGADLFGARMEGADLEGARMEAAVVWQARMEGADLDGARMEGAVLVGARMEGASLIGARMEGANLSRARMEGAVLSGARMEGASLWEARMEGADLSQARMNRSTSLFNAALRGASVKDVDYSSVQLSPDQVMSMFGDTTVKLPVGMDRPKHWPAWELPYFALDDGPTFFSEWHRWQADTENYVPPPPP